ncbi:MAG: heme lyase CcmF/NrfE family subunit [Gemmatimonadota bacterium]
MTRVLGYGAVTLALALAVYGAVAAVAGVRRRRPDLVRSAEIAVYANFVLLTVANLAMIFGLVTHDFSISYVAQVGSRATPLHITVMSLWSALEGSILFWGWILAGYTAAAIYLNRHRKGELIPYATAVLLGVGAFFYLLMAGPANPFGPVFPVPPDGPGPNPLLQNHILMAVHPPLLYLGFVGMTVPFAFAMGALLSGRLDDAWIRTTRRWTVTAWMFLTAAIIAGMWWSYEVLGWGGYWAWDPVENASLMPWLTGTAFLHSVMVQERREMLKVWNLSLISATFLLTILGTFLTRSGIVTSVHAFADGPIGYYFLGFLAVSLLFVVALLAGRADRLRTRGRLDGLMTRESVFLVNNLLLTAFTFTVLLGTLFPLIAEAVRGVQVSVGAPFFNRMTVPLCAALLFLVGVGPALPWRRTTRERLVRTFIPPFAALVVVAVGSLLAGARQPYTIAAFAFGGFALVANLREFAVGVAARRRAHGEGIATALGRLIGGNPRRYGGYTAHIGIIVMAVGIAASSTFQEHFQATLEPGETMRAGDYELRFDRIRGFREPHRFVARADLTVIEDGEPMGTLDPRQNFYDAMSGEPLVTPAVRTRPHEDLYLVLMAFERDGSSATFEASVEPLMLWIWIGGAIIALGAVMAIAPGRRRRALRDGDAAGAAADPAGIATHETGPAGVAAVGSRRTG